MANDNLGPRSDAFQRRGRAWFCTTGLPSDIIIDVQEMSFHLHKFPLMSRSGKLSRIISEESSRNDDEGALRVNLLDIPGGADAFELAAKFCYGVKLELNSINVAPLRCAADYLEMTEEFGEGNLILKTEAFLSHAVLRSWPDSVITLESCKRVLPLAEELNIVKRCVDSIVMKACTDPSLFGWPITEGMSSQGMQTPSGTILWNSVGSAARQKPARSDWWYEDVSLLSFPFFKRVISAMESKGMRSESIAGALMHFAKKFIPGLTRRQGVAPSFSSESCEADQRELLETVESLFPEQKSANTTRFLFGLLRTANILNASDSCKTNLEKRIGLQLEYATLDDLLMPSYSYTIETLYDVDFVRRILQHFMYLQEGHDYGLAHPPSVFDDGGLMASPSMSTPMMMVGKLLDGYLAEVAPDQNLKIDKFLSLAEALPHHARNFEDGLYRAIDIYLKAHPWITEDEREGLCGIMDCQRLTHEACAHAAQNERLPLRFLVQVLFFEQIHLRDVILGALKAADGTDLPRPSNVESVLDLAVPRPELGGDPVRENQLLKMDMDTMRSRVRQLERACSSMRNTIEKIDKPKDGNGSSKKNGWRYISKKFGCKFRMQVCDSQENVMADAGNGTIIRKNREITHRGRNLPRSSPLKSLST